MIDHSRWSRSPETIYTHYDTLIANPALPPKSHAGLNRDAFIANMAKPYEWESNRVVRREDYPSYFGTAAGLIASAEDMAKVLGVIMPA